jgi:hypothetical protein
MSNLLSLKQAAKVLGQDYHKVWSWAKAGRINTTKLEIGGKNFHGVTREEVDRLLKEMQPPGWEALKA